MTTATEPYPIAKMAVEFLRDLPGFEGARHFVLEPFSAESAAIFAHLRCSDPVRLHGGGTLESLALLVMSPRFLWRDYEVELDEDTLAALEVSTPDDVVVLVIVHPKDPLWESTANLYSPLVINQRTGAALQLVPSVSEHELGWAVTTPFPLERNG